MLSNIYTTFENTPKLLTIFSSASNCIYKNLALEEWLFRNKNFYNEDILLIWRNSPSVVIGRYQNPWIEANVNFCKENKIKIVRRYSGGGTVYHDMGNFNISLLTLHDRHNRKENLKKLSKQLNMDFQHLFEPFNKISLNSRDDLIFEPSGSKISGTAARISKGNAYHHFTFLVNPNMKNLHFSLKSPLNVENIDTTATKSIRAKSVGCLADFIKIKEYEFIDDEIMKKTEKSILKAFSSNYNDSKIKSDIFPCEEQFPGIEEILSILKSDDWIFNKTPKFRLQFNDGYIHVQNGIIEESTDNNFPVGEHFQRLFLHVFKLLLKGRDRS